MCLYGPTFHVTPVDLSIIFQCNIYPVSCLVEIKLLQLFQKNCFNCFKKIVSIVSKKLFQLFQKNCFNCFKSHGE